MTKIKYFAAAAIAAGVFVSLGLAIASAQVDNNSNAQGEVNSQANITFPIPQLGNCASKDACKAYCSDTSHMQACIQFAQSHGLVSASEASQEKSFARIIANGSGPGGCDSPDSCNTYCSNTNHLQACLSFAQAHGLANTQMAEQGQKVLSYLQSGGRMPGNCDSQDACQAYCNELAHAEECFAFSQKIGITPPNNGMPQPTLAQMQKIAALAQSGQTPGGCTTMQACQEYCNDPSHGQACQQFGQKVGFTGGPDRVDGPGGCNSPDSCQTYCNDPSHQTECLQFAQKHGFMTQGQVQNFQNGMNQFQNGLKNAPPQVLTCLQTQVGEKILGQMQSGQFTPTPDVMSKMQTCFQSFRPSTSTPPGNFSQNGSGPQGPQMTVGELLQKMPPVVAACIKNKFEGSLPDSSSYPDQNFNQTAQSCFAANPGSYGPQSQKGGNQQQGQFNQQNFSPMNGNQQVPFQPQQGNYGNVSGTPPMPPFPGSSTPNFQGQQPMPGNYQPQQGQFAPMHPYNSSSTNYYPQPGSPQPMPAGTQVQSSSIQSFGGSILNAIRSLFRR